MRNKPAEDIKCHIVDYLIATHPNAIIGNEIMYGTKRKVVDLLLVDKNELTAIEIKSDSDNTIRLSEQIKEYSKVFDKIFVISTPSHQKEISLILPKSIGLLVVNGQSITQMKVAKLIKRHNKKEILYTIPSLYLKKVFRLNSKSHSDDIRKKLLNIQGEHLHEVLVSYFTSKIKTSFSSFMNDRGRISNPDDIPTLSSGDIIE